MNTSKPDLMTGAPRAAQKKRILAQLEHGPRASAMVVRTASWSVDGWTIGLCVLLLLMCSVAWLMHEKRITPETFRQASTSPPVRSSSTQERTKPLVVSAPAEPQAAAIVNEPVQPSAARATTPTPTAITAAIANGASAQTSLPPPSHKQVAAAARTPAGRATPAAAPVAQSSSDTDVALLTALVAHAGKPTSVAPERSRDIVERQEGDITAQLLARCKQLGLIEGMLCRSRICAGRWESDAACRAPAPAAAR